jgi:hypothetical protein
MGRHAQCAWIFRVFAIVLAMASPAFAVAAVTADAVALGAGAGCSNGRLDVTLTNNGATWESWSATNLAGNTLTFGEQFTGFPPGTSTRSFPQNFSPSQPDGTLIGSYAYVGEPSPDATEYGRVLRLLQSARSPEQRFSWRASGRTERARTQRSKRRRSWRQCRESPPSAR